MKHSMTNEMTRRSVIRNLGVLAAGGCVSAKTSCAQTPGKWELNYVLSSAMYGDFSVSEILPEVEKTGSVGIDIWRKPHGTQREQITEMGDDKFQALLNKTGAKFTMSSCYPLGPFGQDDELRWVAKNGGRMTMASSRRMGEIDPVGEEAKKQVKAFFEKLKPHYELAEELGVTMVIENHKKSMLSSPDSIRYFAEFNPSKNVGIGFAPHHLYDAVDDIPALIEDCGKENLPFIYFQEFHKSSKEAMPDEAHWKQLPGFGTLDYKPILAALKKIDFSGVAELFGHPVPRGIPMSDSVASITDKINFSRKHIADLLATI